MAAAGEPRARQADIDAASVNHWPTMLKDEVIETIRKAFAGTPAPRQGEIAHCEQCELFVGRFLAACPSTWEEIQAHDIAYEYAALTAVTPTAWRFLLPAYLTWHLEHYEHSDSNTVDHLVYGLTRTEKTDDYIVACYESLSPAQVQAVAAFLTFIARQSHDPILAEDAQSALSLYWRDPAA